MQWRDAPSVEPLARPSPLQSGVAFGRREQTNTSLAPIFWEVAVRWLASPRLPSMGSPRGLVKPETFLKNLALKCPRKAALKSNPSNPEEEEEAMNVAVGRRSCTSSLSSYHFHPQLCFHPQLSIDSLKLGVVQQWGGGGGRQVGEKGKHSSPCHFSTANPPACSCCAEENWQSKWRRFSPLSCSVLWNLV